MSSRTIADWAIEVSKKDGMWVEIVSKNQPR